MGRQGWPTGSAALDGPAAAAFERGFADFLREYGSRGPNEWEMRSPSWETRPELALAAIDRMRLSPDGAAPARQNAARADVREATAAAIADALEADPAVQGQFLAAVRAAQMWLPARERTKTNAIRMVHEARMTMRELGRRMVARGAFDHIEDFGFLRRDELDAFVADPGSFTAAIRQRRADYEELGGLEPPFVFVGRAAPAGDLAGAIDGRPGPRRGRHPRRDSRAARAPWKVWRASCSTRPTRARSSRATCWWRRSPTRRGHRCSSPPLRSWSTSVPCRAMP